LAYAWLFLDRVIQMMFWAYLLLAIGLFVVVLELFLPSGGILGILAGALIVSSIVIGFMEGVKSGALILLITVIALPALLGAMVKIWPHTPLGKLILLKDLKPEDVLPNRQRRERSESLEGQLGVAKTKMLPSGIIVINGEKYDALSEGFAIEIGDPIKVTSVRENRIYVQPYDASVDDASDLPARDRDILAQPIEELGIESLEDPLS
jgi:membrane-bound ClpP family serine protease